MEKVRGIVMELAHKKVILMTPGGEFKRVPVKGIMPEIGEEITLTLPTANKLFRFNRLVAAIAAAFVLMVVSSAFLNNFGQTPPAIAYVTIEINPSLELGIDENQLVVETKPLNNDAEKILNQVELKGLKIDQAVKEVTSQAINLGYISTKKENNVIVSYSPVVNSKKVEKIDQKQIEQKNIEQVALENKLQKTVENTLEANHMGAVVTTLEVDSALRDKALEVGLSTGRYAILLKAQEAGLEMTPEDFKGTTVAEALKGAGSDVNSVVGSTYQEPMKILLVDMDKKIVEVAQKNKQEAGLTNESPKVDLGKDKLPLLNEPRIEKNVIAIEKKFMIIQPIKLLPREKPKLPVADPSLPVKDNVPVKVYEEPKLENTEPKIEPKPEPKPEPIIEPKPQPIIEPKPDLLKPPLLEPKPSNNLKPPSNPQ